MEQKPSKAFLNASFCTMDARGSTADCVITANGIITETGDHHIMKDKIENIECVDLQGRFVLPGFIDLYTMPAIQAYLLALHDHPRFSSAMQRDWIQNLISYLISKGVTTLCLHPSESSFALQAEQVMIGPERLSFLTDVTFQTEFEKKLSSSDDFYEDILSDPSSSGLIFDPIYNNIGSTRDGIRQLTSEASFHIGHPEIGSIAPGKRADFAVFESDPRNLHIHAFMFREPLETIIAGESVSSNEKTREREMYDMIYGNFD